MQAIQKIQAQSISNSIRIAGASVIGAGHISESIPNQDAIGWDSTVPNWAIVAVSDGHGDPLYVRSAAGAQAAVAAAISALKDRLANLDQAACDAEAAALEQSTIWNLAYEGWCQAVDADLANNPLSVEEYAARVGDPEEAIQLFFKADGNRRAYGATLLIGAISPVSAWFWRLGDGDVVVTADRQNMSVKSLFPDAPGDVTHSLCGAVPGEHLETRLLTGNELPGFFLLSSDGYRKSYDLIDEFLAVPREIAVRVAEHGLDAVAQRLPLWLSAVTADGSRDDITAAIVLHEEKQP